MSHPVFHTVYDIKELQGQHGEVHPLAGVSIGGRLGRTIFARRTERHQPHHRVLLLRRQRICKRHRHQRKHPGICLDLLTTRFTPVYDHEYLAGYFLFSRRACDSLVNSRRVWIQTRRKSAAGCSRQAAIRPDGSCLVVVLRINRADCRAAPLLSSNFTGMPTLSQWTSVERRGELQPTTCAKFEAVLAGEMIMDVEAHNFGRGGSPTGSGRTAPLD